MVIVTDFRNLLLCSRHNYVLHTKSKFFQLIGTEDRAGASDEIREHRLGIECQSCVTGNPDSKTL